MTTSRIKRFEDRRLRKRTLLAVAGSIAILVFIGLFGLKLLEGFSLLLDKLHPTIPTSNTTQTLILPPTLDPLAEATKSATLQISGKGQKDLTLILYLDDSEAKREKIVKDDGTFTLELNAKSDGSHILSAKLTDEKENISELSNVVTVVVKSSQPSLEVAAPEDNKTLYGDPNTVTITGKTDENNSLTINDRFVLVKNDGSFSFTATLKEGDNDFTILARDPAGNEARLTRHVTYHK